MKSKNKYKETVIELLRKSPYYGNFLLMCKPVFCDDLPADAGINIVNNQVRILINDNTFYQYDSDLRIGILKHELGHLFLDHLYRTNLPNKQVANIAMDCALNQYIPELKDDMGYATFNNVKQMYESAGGQFAFLRNRNFEEYYNLLIEVIKSNDESNAYKMVDHHDNWDHSDLDTADNVKDIIKRIHEKTKVLTNGNIPSELVDILEKLFTNRYNWKKELAQFVANSDEVYSVYTMYKPNRRFPPDPYIVNPGRRYEVKLNLGIAIDTSGSMLDEWLQVLFGEIDNISRLIDLNITVIEADAVVQNVYKYEPNKTISVKGRGGTAYQPALDKAKELNLDALIYMGDMDCADTPKDIGVPILWACVNGGTPPVEWGRRITLKMDKE